MKRSVAGSIWPMSPRWVPSARHGTHAWAPRKSGGEVALDLQIRERLAEPAACASSASTPRSRSTATGSS